MLREQVKSNIYRNKTSYKSILCRLTNVQKEEDENKSMPRSCIKSNIYHNKTSFGVGKVYCVD